MQINKLMPDVRAMRAIGGLLMMWLACASEAGAAWKPLRQVRGQKAEDSVQIDIHQEIRSIRITCEEGMIWIWGATAKAGGQDLELQQGNKLLSQGDVLEWVIPGGPRKVDRLLIQHGRGAFRVDMEPAGDLANEQGRSAAVRKNPAQGMADADAAYDAKDYARALALYKPAAEAGAAHAQARMGFLYRNGYAVDKDYVEARKWFELAVLQGNGMAQNGIGLMHEMGEGTPVNHELAFAWYRKAAESGYPSGQRNLGFAYQRGVGVARDYQQALYWYQRAVDQGFAMAMNDLGVMHQNGLGTAKDMAAAARWFRQAADLGMSHAQYNLATLYLAGDGVPQSDQEAANWFRKAAGSGYAPAVKSLAELEKKIATAGKADEKANTELEEIREKAQAEPEREPPPPPTWDSGEQDYEMIEMPD